jgi:uncharacterized membrane protein
MTQEETGLPAQEAPAQGVAPGAPVVNVGDLERLASVALGGALAVHGLVRRTWTSALAGLVGVGLIHRGLTGHCIIYQALGRDTADRRGGPEAEEEGAVPLEIERSILVKRPRQDLFQFWRKLENLPRIVTHLESVRVDLMGRSHWAAVGPQGVRAEWNARFVKETEDEVLAWEAVPGSEMGSWGWVSLLDHPEGTEVVVRFGYRPVSKAARSRLQAILGREPASQLEEDLRHWKRIMEAET